MHEFIVSLRYCRKCYGTIRKGGPYFAYSHKHRLESTAGHAGENPGHD